MANPAIRGLWNLDEAVALRWHEAQLDTVIRNEWPIASRLSTKYEPLNEEMAEPVPPGPYVVYERFEPTVVGHMTGASAVDRENQSQTVLIQFGIHAKSFGIETAKARCIRLAKSIAAAYDPHNSPWTIYDDKMVKVDRFPDFGAWEGDDEYAWILQYNVMLDVEYLI